MTRSTPSPRFTSPMAWRFGGILLLQLAIVLAVPFPKAITLATGTTIALQTTPVDPYDILRGRYVTLGYEAERVNTLKNLPGWNTRLQNRDRQSSLHPIYLILEPVPDTSDTAPVQPWRPVAIAWTRPRNLTSPQLVIKGTYDTYYRSGNVDLGLGEYFIPEERGDVLEKDMEANRDAVFAEIKLDRRGNSALVGLWVEDRNY